jgi:MraZ protein
VTNNIDKKGRVSFPAHFRSALKDSQLSAVILFGSLKGKYLEGCPIEVFEKRCQEADTHGLDLESAFLFAESQLVHFDTEGRLSIPKALLEHAALKDQVVFVGRGRTFEVWNPQGFAQCHEEMRRQLRVHIEARS